MDGDLSENEILCWAQLFDKSFTDFEQLPEELRSLNGITKYEAFEGLLR